MERSGAAEAGGRDHHDRVVGDEGPVEQRVLRGGAPHAEHVPRVLDVVAGGVAVQEPVDDLRGCRVAGVQGVEPEIGPHGGEAAEDLVGRDLPAAVDLHRRGRRHQDREVVAGLAVAGGEDVPVGGLPQDPVAPGSAHPAYVGSQAHPVHVHVDAQGGGGRVVREPALQAVDLAEVQSGATHLCGQGRVEVPAGPELVEVLLEEAVLPVVDGRPLVESPEHLLGEQLGRPLGGRHGSPPGMSCRQDGR